MDKRLIVLDTNCLLRSLSWRGDFYDVWESFILGRYVLCVSTEILEEYEEIVSSHISPRAAKLAIETILRATNVLRVDAQYRFRLITIDEDDNKFVDCAVSASAAYIVTNDKHFNILNELPWPKITVMNIQEFLDLLQRN